MIRRRFLLALALLGGLAACDERKQAAVAPLTPPLTGVVLERLDGSPDALENYRGKLVVLNVWATWCAPCRREMPGLQRLADQLDPKSFAVLGVAVNDSPAMVREFLRAKGVSFAGHVDQSGNVMWENFGVEAIPSTFVIDPAGRVIWTKAGELAWDDPAVVTWLKELRS